MLNQQIRNFFNKRNVFVALILLVILFLCVRVPIDPDLGWHLRNGQYIWQNKDVPRLDPYSHTFPEYPVIAHEWLSDLLLFGLHSLGPKTGVVAMAAVFAVIATLAFWLAGRSFPARREYQALAALLALLVSLPIVGVRPQVISLFGLGLVFFILYRFRAQEKSKSVYFLPLIFLVWVNLHGGFTFGLFALFLFFSVELIRFIVKHLFQKARKLELVFRTMERASFIKLAVIGLVSGGATLLNPYGLRLYHEIYLTFINTIGSAYIRQNIGEWNPVFFGHRMSIQFIVYLALFAVLLLFSIKKVDLTHLLITVVFFFIGISSWRNLPLLMLAITPFWVSIAQTLTGDTLARLVQRRFAVVLFALAAFLVIRQQVTGLVRYGLDSATLAKKEGYPHDAIQYLKEHPLKGEMLNEYNYGGYTVWNYPEKKVFIDGRMAIWDYQGKNVYQDWVKIGRTDEGYLELIDRYKVDWVFVRKRLAVAAELRQSDNWEQIYEDDLFCIIVRKGSQE